MTVKIPLTNQPNQNFTCTIPLDDTNVTLQFYLFWNRIAEYWQMSITDVSTGTMLIDSLPMLYGGGYYENILAQYEYLGIGSAFIYPLVSNPPNSPGVEDWDENFILLWAA